MIKSKKQQGFTLIEILVVVAIVGLLATIALTAFALVRSKGRDAKRMADIRQINSAIQFYINDNGNAPYVNGTAPYTGALNCGVGNGTGPCQAIYDNTANWNLLAGDLAQYLPSLPRDPKSPGEYVYVYVPPGSEPYSCFSNCTYGADQQISNYAIFARRMENSSPILNMIHLGVSTFGFGSHIGYDFGD